MIDFTTEIITGVSFGFVIAVVPAIVVGVAGAVGASRDRPLSGPESVAIGTTLAACNGYAIGFVTVPAFRSPEQLLRLGVATAVVAIYTLYAKRLGERLLSELPIGASYPLVRGRALSAEAIDAVDAIGQVTVRPSGDIRTVAGYPPLSPQLRETLSNESWRLPADLPLSELETELENRLQTSYDLPVVSVSIDGRGRASIDAAPPSSEFASRVPTGWRSVSIPAVVPTRMASDEEVIIHAGGEFVRGIVLAVGPPRSATGAAVTDESIHGTGTTDRDETQSASVCRPAGKDGGESRVTVAVPTADVETVLRADRGHVIVPSCDADGAFEAFSLLERAAQRIKKLPVADLVTALNNADDIDCDDISPLAASTTNERASTAAHGREWITTPPIDELDDYEEVFIVGDAPLVKRLVECDLPSATVPNAPTDSDSTADTVEVAEQ